jgi:hypothetical protein
MPGSAGPRPMEAAGIRPVTSIRSAEKTRDLRSQLLDVFPDNGDEIDEVLRRRPNDEDIERLSAILVGLLDDSS